MAKATTASKAAEQVPKKRARVREIPIEEPPRRAVPTNTANGARLLTDRSRLTTPRSVVGSTRTAAKRTG